MVGKQIKWRRRSWGTAAEGVGTAYSAARTRGARRNVHGLHGEVLHVVVGLESGLFLARNAPHVQPCSHRELNIEFKIELNKLNIEFNIQFV
jgi:hypothetical protein